MKDDHRTTRRVRLSIVACMLLTVCVQAQELDSLFGEILQPHFDGLPGMVRRHQVRILVHWSRTDYFIAAGEQHGVMWEAARDFERFLNKTLRTGKRPVSCVVIPVSRDDLVRYLEDGLGDISFVGLRETPELSGRIAFSAPYATDVAEIVMRHRDSPALHSVDDLSGRTVHLRPTSKYFSTLKELNDRLRALGRDEARLEPLSEHLSDADIMELVDAGVVQYTILDGYRGEFWATVFPRAVPERTLPLAEHRTLRFALRKGTPKLAALLNEFIRTHKLGTEYGNVLYKRYFKANTWARSALGSEERRRFRSMVDLFRRYGARYGFDHLMLTAQGFQESGLDQNVRSAVGAIGVMQVMPSTGKAMNVGDIRHIDANIHAGVKYMHRLAMQYFDDTAIDPLNRTLLCFAAYNAGPARIRKFQREAAKRGFDPNIWFDHVERIAVEHGNRETVQYVVNITKYYVAYKLAEEERVQRERAKKDVRRHE